MVGDVSEPVALDELSESFGERGVRAEHRGVVDVEHVAAEHQPRERHPDDFGAHVSASSHSGRAGGVWVILW